MLESLKPLYNRSSHLGEQLVNDGLIKQEDLQEALVQATQKKKFLGETLLLMGLVPSKTLGPYVGAHIKCQFYELADRNIDSSVTDIFPEARARRLKALPVQMREHDVIVAMSDPLDLSVVDELKFLLGKPITPVLAFEGDLDDAINRVYTKVGGDIEIDPPPQDDEPDEQSLYNAAAAGPVANAVHQIITGAISSGASDIHIEPQDKSVRVRYRVDGLLIEQVQIKIPPKSHSAVASRIKIMANLDIAERRRPHDGRITFKNNGRENDLRVSIMPTIYGEKVVMRILERNRTVTLDQVGFFKEQQELFETMIRRPHGMVLITGPTGSGKSTTLQAGLSKINNPNLNISTVEDPVEYQIAGVNHTQVNPQIGVTFAKGLTTLVRQDPDIIMVGEIRDKETAEIAIQAALTGHLVLSTLHTNDAPGAITRLVNMGIEPFLIASSLVGVVGQRLLRLICPYCKAERPAAPSELDALGMPHSEEFAPMLAYGAGCNRCGERGMKGRTAVYEIMPVTEEIRQLTLRRASSTDIKAKAIEQGMKTMFDSGVQKVQRHETTLEEINRMLVVEE